MKGGECRALALPHPPAPRRPAAWLTAGAAQSCGDTGAGRRQPSPPSEFSRQQGPWPCRLCATSRASLKSRRPGCLESAEVIPGTPHPAHACVHTHTHARLMRVTKGCPLCFLIGSSHRDKSWKGVKLKQEPLPSTAAGRRRGRAQPLRAQPGSSRRGAGGTEPSLDAHVSGEQCCDCWGESGMNGGTRGAELPARSSGKNKEDCYL